MQTPTRRGKPFEPGNRFGKGRPAGSRNIATLAIDQLLEGESEAVMRKVVQFAKKGDPTAMRLFAERVCPARRERLVQLELGELKTAEDLQSAFQAVAKALAKGDIDTRQAEHVTRVLEFGRKAIETGDLARGLEEVRTELRDLKENYERPVA
jgi:hypothetical protein